MFGRDPEQVSKKGPDHPCGDRQPDGVRLVIRTVLSHDAGYANIVSHWVLCWKYGQDLGGCPGHFGLSFTGFLCGLLSARKNGLTVHV